MEEAPQRREESYLSDNEQELDGIPYNAEAFLELGKEDFGKFINWNNKYDELEYPIGDFLEDAGPWENRIDYVKHRIEKWLEWTDDTRVV